MQEVEEVVPLLFEFKAKYTTNDLTLSNRVRRK